MGISSTGILFNKINAFHIKLYGKEVGHVGFGYYSRYNISPAKLFHKKVKPKIRYLPL